MPKDRPPMGGKSSKSGGLSSDPEALLKNGLESTLGGALAPRPYPVLTLVFAGTCTAEGRDTGDIQLFVFTTQGRVLRCGQSGLKLAAILLFQSSQSWS